MGPQVNERVGVNRRATFAVKTVSAKALDISAKVDLIRSLKLSPHFVGGDSEDSGVGKPEPMAVNPALPPVRV